MRNYLLFTLISFLTFSNVIFSQTTFQGPATGSVANGVMVTTDDFAFVPSGDEILGEPRVIEFMEYNAEPLFIQGEAPVSDNYFYVESGAQGGAEIGINFELHSFESIGYQSLWPPDPAMSVGPNHVVAAVNNRFHIYDRDGNLLKNISESQWISQVVNTPVISDPQVIYDHHHGKWVMLWFTRNDAILQAPFVIAHSDDENPLGIWYMYAINSELNGSTYAGNWGDYPKIGYDDQALYINSRQFGFGGGYQYNKIRILNSSDFYAAQGGAVSWTDLWNIRVIGDPYDVIHPFYSYDTGGNAAYFVYARNQGASFYELFKITDPITNPVLTSTRYNLSTFYSSAPSAQQLGGPAVANFTWITKAPVLRDGLLYAAHAIRNTQHTTYSSIKYFVFDINSNTLIEEVEQGEDGYFFIQPAITVDKDHNIALTYSKSSSTSYIGAYYSTRLSTDPPGLLSSSKVMTEGLSPHGNSTRWGDYFSAAVDPVNQYDIWLFCEFAKNNNWSTWLTEIRMKPFPGVHAFLGPHSIDFSDVEIGTTSSTIPAVLANYGENDLVISTIASSFEDFNLVTSLTFPVTLASYDSLTLEFTYSPTTLGNTSVLYPIPTNDPDFQGIALSGNSYRMIPAIEKTIYASSGSQNSGNIMTINPTTGAGTNIGPSLFDEITSVAINPLDGKIYGVVAGNSSTDLVKINAGEGDAYLISTLNIPLMASIAYDTSGVLYGITRTGDLYTIDVVNGSANFVVDAVGSYLGITFHPATNELWATSRAAIPPNNDAIFTINLSTGDTSIIGHTGLGKQTNDIVFDENLNLFGVIGSSTLVNDFISINTSTGVGTIVGSTGFKHILGLAYVDQILTSVEDNISGTIPSDYDLKQNYPNPFNPTTKIDFSLPVESNVKLVIYNILGQEVIRLIRQSNVCRKSHDGLECKRCRWK